MHIAMGLVDNLGLAKLPPKEPQQMMLDFDAQGCPKPFSPSARTIEERRAVIGCFFISSVYEAQFLCSLGADNADAG